MLCTIMARISPKSPSPPARSWSADSLAFKPRLLTKAQFAEARRKRAEQTRSCGSLRSLNATGGADCMRRATTLAFYAALGLAVAWAIVSFWPSHFKQ